MDENKLDDLELTEDTKEKAERLHQMIKKLWMPKKISHQDILDALLNDEEMQHILLSRKYVYSDGKLYPLDPSVIDSSLVQADLSDKELNDSILRMDGNYKIVYENNKLEQLKVIIKRFISKLVYVVWLPFRMLGELFDWVIDLFLDAVDLDLTVAVQESINSIHKIKSGEEKEINCDDLDVKELLRKYNEFDSEFKAIPKTFSEALGYHMNQRNMSGAKLSDITGMTASTISKMLHEDDEEVPNHKLKSIISICIALHLPPVMSYNLIDLAGCRLLNNKKDRIYTMLLNYYYEKDIEYCDQVLEQLGMPGLKIY